VETLQQKFKKKTYGVKPSENMKIDKVGGHRHFRCPEREREISTHTRSLKKCNVATCDTNKYLNGDLCRKVTSIIGYGLS